MRVAVKLDALTSLRFFAAAMIVLGHGHRLFGSLEIANTLSLAQGVSFFFVLSGFILAYNYPELSTYERVLAFFKARFARIWPMHMAAIVLVVILAGDLNLGSLSLVQAFFAAIAHFFLIQSAIPLKDVFLAFNGVAWSISTEMFFYLAFPFLITSIIPGLKKKLGLLLLLCFLHIFFAAAWKIPVEESLPQLNLMGLLYVNPLVRVLEFFVGVLTCRVFQSLKSVSFESRFSSFWFSGIEVVVIAMTILSMWLTPRLVMLFAWQGSLAQVVNFYFVKSGSFLVFAGLILVFAFGKGVVSRLLSCPLMITLGEISFALYLVHSSVLKWCENQMTYFGVWSDSAKSACYWLVSLLIAFLLHKAIETPCRRLILSSTRFRPMSWVMALFAGKQKLYVIATVVMLTIMLFFPFAISGANCSRGVCDAVVNESRLDAPGVFGGYVTLRALRVQNLGQGRRSLDLLFQVERPLPRGHKLAVHMVASDGSILAQTDFGLVRTGALASGEFWLEQVQIPPHFVSPNVVNLGLVIYSDPSNPLMVNYPNTDYDGRRMLINLATLGF